jgi:hypothetical protein
VKNQKLDSFRSRARANTWNEVRGIPFHPSDFSPQMNLLNDTFGEALKDLLVSPKSLFAIIHDSPEMRDLRGVVFVTLCRIELDFQAR